MSKNHYKKERGFTLIEILAVIVILGIILFLAVPAVIGMIEKSKGKLALTSAVEYINEIENKALMNDEIDYYGKFSTSDLKELDKSNGNKPTIGFLEIGGDEKITRGTFCINNYKIYYDGKEAKIDYNGSCDSIKSFVELVYFNPNTGLKCNKNDSSSINGVKSGCMKWYLYSYNDDSTVDLILDHNTSNEIQWNSTGNVNEGPQEALLKLKEDTLNWNGVPERIDKYDFISKYDNYEVNYAGVRARFLTVNEILSISPNPNGFSVSSGHYHDAYCFEDGSNGYWECASPSSENINEESKISKYSFLYDNTTGCISYGCEFEQEGATGYWTSDSFNHYNSYYDREAWYVYFNGSLRSSYLISTNGIRPVITIPRSLLD